MTIGAETFADEKHGMGFTLTELLVACMVMTTALLGVNALFRHAMNAEAQATLRWYERSIAQSVADHLAETIENVVNIPNVQTIKLETNTRGGSLVCQTPSERKRYRWGTNGSESDYYLQLQAMIFAGTQNLDLEAGTNDSVAERQWDRISSTVIANGLKKLSIRVKLLDGSSSGWKERWEGLSGKVTVQIQSQVGNQTVERIVTPQASSYLTEPAG